MGSYEIVGPCAYVQDGSYVRQRTPGKVVEIDDEVAANLGPAVKPAGSPPAAPDVPATPDQPPPSEPAPANPAEGSTAPPAG